MTFCTVNSVQLGWIANSKTRTINVYPNRSRSYGIHINDYKYPCKALVNEILIVSKNWHIPTTHPLTEKSFTIYATRRVLKSKHLAFSLA